MLLSHNIKPILVFDGRHLPAKAETEAKRREYIYIDNENCSPNKIIDENLLKLISEDVKQQNSEQSN